MKLAGALMVGLAGVSSALAVEVRPAAEAEIAQALQGCWTKEPTFEDKRLEADGFVNTRQLCFRDKGAVETALLTGDRRELEGLGTDGVYSIINGKLAMVMHGDFPDGWIFSSRSLSCDVLMRVGKAMRLENCVDSEGKALAKMSFSRNKQ